MGGSQGADLCCAAALAGTKRLRSSSLSSRCAHLQVMLSMMCCMLHTYQIDLSVSVSSDTVYKVRNGE